MAVLTAKGISAVAVELLTRTLVLPMTATRIPGEEFAGSNGANPVDGSHRPDVLDRPDVVAHGQRLGLADHVAVDPADRVGGEYDAVRRGREDQFRLRLVAG